MQVQHGKHPFNVTGLNVYSASKCRQAYSNYLHNDCLISLCTFWQEGKVDLQAQVINQLTLM